MRFESSDQERQIRIYCNQLGIPYDKLTPREFAGELSVLKKSKHWRNAQSRQGKMLTHGRGEGKK